MKQEEVEDPGTEESRIGENVKSGAKYEEKHKEYGGKVKIGWHIL